MNANPSDTDVLRRLNQLQQETDRECVLEIIDIYCEEAPKLIAAMKAAKESGDSRAFAEASHTLKGSSMNLGAARMAELCSIFEEKGKLGALPSSAGDMNEVAEEFDHLASIFTRFKQDRM